MNCTDRYFEDPPETGPDGYIQGAAFLGLVSWIAGIALGAWLAWGMGA